MLNITDKYRELATAGGRQPFCVIRAGEKTFLDDSIKSFQLQEVIFPDELTFGAACSRRFHFELETAENIPLSAEIRPYIGFGEYSEEAELCPLGVFYISKRYRRRSHYSVTCYDRMYRLEDDYESELSFPADSNDVLNEICERYGLEFDGSFGSYTCGKCPSDETVRNVLGYLAGLEGANALFDRYGRLCFRKLTDSGFFITRKNYVSLDLKQDPMTVEKIEIDDGDSVFEKGEGTKLGTYRFYDPFASERTALLIYNMMSGFTYYGLELDMQGLPFLEAGDIVTVQNDGDDGIFTAVIGELNFTYDGNFHLDLSSKSKNPVQDSQDKKAQEEILKQAEKSLSTVYYNYRSERDVVVGGQLTSVAVIDMEALRDTSAVLAAQLVAKPQSDCLLTLSYTVEDKETPPVVTAALKKGEDFPICLHNFLSSIPSGYITVRIYAKAQGGTVLFGKGGIIATVSGQYLAENAMTRSPNRTIYQGFAPLIRKVREKMETSWTEQPFTKTQIPVDPKPSERFSFSREKKHFHIGWSEFGYAPVGPQRAETYSKDNVMYVRAIFFNPLFTQDAAALPPAFTVRAVFTDSHEDHAVTAAEWDNNILLTLTVEGMFVGASEVHLLYDSAKGDITDGFSGVKIQDFDIIAEEAEEDMI